MLDVQAHKDHLEALLATAKAGHPGKFGAWCCFALTLDASAFLFLIHHAGAPGDLESKVTDYLDEIWRGNEASQLSVDLVQIDWDPDEVETADEAAAQSATDLLAGLSFLSKWCSQRDIKKLVACAEVVINRIDYLESFELMKHDVANAVDREALSQTDFFRDLCDGRVGEADKFRYHEWLSDAGNP